MWNGEYLSHKTADLITDHDYKTTLWLFGFRNEYFESLMYYVRMAAILHGRLKVTFDGSVVHVRKVKGHTA